MVSSKKIGFTLVELLVVMSIIGILAAALTMQITKARDTSRAVKCKANLRNLAQSALNYAVDHGELPWAGSHEIANSTRSGSGYTTTVDLRRGWVDWTKSDGSSEFWSKDYMGGASFSGKGVLVTKCSGKPGYMSVTNGVLWSYMGKDLSAYVCDSQVRNMDSTVKLDGDVKRSYVMNCYFGYNKDYAPIAPARHRDIYLDNLSANGSASSLLLFAELGTQDSGDKNTKEDGVLETVIQGYNNDAETTQAPAQEYIGFNHRIGGGGSKLSGSFLVAHVAFADGHVDALSQRTTKTSAQRKALTYFLCNGFEIPKDVANWQIPAK